MHDLKQIFENVVAGKAALIDVREEREWEVDRIQYARLVPLSELEEGHIPKNLPTDIPLYTHCRAGRRSLVAADILAERYPNVEGLQCSFDDLKALESQQL